MPPRIRHDCVPVRLGCALLTSLALSSTCAVAERAPPAAPARAVNAASTRTISTETLPALLQRGTQAFAAGDFAQAAAAFAQVENDFGSEAAWTSGSLPRCMLPLRGFAALRAGDARSATDDLAAFLERFPEEQAQRGFATYALAIALHQSGKLADALTRFEDYERLHPGTAQAALARLQRAEICFELGRADDGFSHLHALRADAALSETLRVQARLRALEHAVETERGTLAAQLLLDEPWSVSTMPELGVLAFAAMETGDRLLASGRAREAVRAFQLVPPKRRLVAAQIERLDSLKRTFAERAPAAASGQGLFWVDYYRARIQRITSQLAALQAADDFTGPLRLRLGQSLLLAGRPREAWLCFESIATDSAAPADLGRDAHYRWILAAAELLRWQDALVIARAFVERFPGSDQAPEAFFLISRAHLEQQDLTEAEQVLSDILEKFPSHPAALRSRFTRGWVRTMREDYIGAREDFESCIAAAPGGPLAVQAGLWRGLTFHFAREREKALAAFDALAAAHPQHPLLPEILYRRGVTLYALREFGRARIEMERFVSTYPMHPRWAEALVLLGDILMAAGELDRARDCFAQVPAEAADAHVYAVFQTGKILRAQADYAGMVEHFSRFVDLAANKRLPRVSEALVHLGWAQESLGRAEAALPVYIDALARFGDDPAAAEVDAALGALHRLARRLRHTSSAASVHLGDLAPLSTGDFEGWLRAERDRALAQARHTWLARLTLALADLHLGRKELAQAELLVLDLAGAVPIEALDARALARVGETLQAIGSEEAAAYYRRLLVVYPRHPARASAFLGLAGIAQARRQFDEALGWAGRFESETPSHPLGYRVTLLCGEILEQTGRHAEAARRYEELLRLKSARGRPHALALGGLARCAQAAGDAARAIAYHQRVYTLHRAQRDLAAIAYLESAPLFAQLGNAAAAAATYREMLALGEIGDSGQRERAEAALRALENEPQAPSPTAEEDTT